MLPLSVTTSPWEHDLAFRLLEPVAGKRERDGGKLDNTATVGSSRIMGEEKWGSESFQDDDGETNNSIVVIWLVLGDGFPTLQGSFLELTIMNCGIAPDH